MKNFNLSRREEVKIKEQKNVTTSATIEAAHGSIWLVGLELNAIMATGELSLGFQACFYGQD